MDYLLTCLICGSQLQPVVLGPDSAPWLCHVCHRGYWVCELGDDGRRGWERKHRSFKGWAHVVLEPLRGAELEAARERGTSCLPEQLAMLQVAQLQALLKQVREPFAALVAAAVKAKGG